MKEDWLSERLPDFLIIGSPKSGTTSLYQYLKKHPDIFLSSPLKEPRLFTDLDRVQTYFFEKSRLRIDSLKDLIRHHMLQGYKGEKLFGEATAEYTFGIMSHLYNIPRKVKKANSAMKFIYLLRNPLARIVSNYLHLNRLGRIGKIDLKSFDFSRAPDGVLMLQTSLYYEQLKHYLAFFPKNRFHIVILEELVADFQNTLDCLFRFLGVDSHFFRGEMKRYNISTNRQGLAENTLRFSARDFGALLPSIERDVSHLEKFLSRSLDVWDLSEKLWVV